jgi:hypothetical protein
MFTVDELDIFIISTDSRDGNHFGDVNAMVLDPMAAVET